jgi:hypothetical protein
VVSIDSLWFPIVPLVFLFYLKGLVPLNKIYVFQRLSTLFLGLICNCGGRSKFLVVAARHNECKGIIAACGAYNQCVYRWGEFRILTRIGKYFRFAASATITDQPKKSVLRSWETIFKFKGTKPFKFKK